MGRNHEVTSRHPLLDDSGRLSEPGWSRSLVQQYDRSQIKAPKWRIKEWDYYLVLSDSFAGAFTISDDGYIGLQSVSLLTFGEKPWEHTETVLNAFPMGKIGLPSDSSNGPTVYSDKRLQMRFDVETGFRTIKCSFANFCDGKPFECDIRLEQPQRRPPRRRVRPDLPGRPRASYSSSATARWYPCWQQTSVVHSNCTT